MEPHYLIPALLGSYKTFLTQEERAAATVEKYMRDLHRFSLAMKRRAITKEAVIAYKKALLCQYAASSANSMLAPVNGLFGFLGWHECRVRPVRIQHNMYRDSRKELSREEYYSLLKTAKEQGKTCLYHILETIGSTGIRISELRFITVQAVAQGKAEVRNKGKSRTVFLSKQLCMRLKEYCRVRRIRRGSVFVTRTGRALDRSNIWTMMKALCKRAGVAREKVFPHNLRHLFALTFYRKERDLDHLAAILGHSNINTTRIYVQSSGAECRQQMELLHLMI